MPDFIQFACEHCGKKLKVKAELAGKKVKCPGCAQAARVPARMEEAAKTHNVACAISGDVAENLRGEEARLIPIGHEKIRGSAVEIPIYEYRVAGEGCANAVRQVPLQASPSAEPG